LHPSFRLWRSTSSPPSSTPTSSPPKQIEARTTKLKYKESVEFNEMQGLMWTGNLRTALARAMKDTKLVFIEFTAATNVSGVTNHKKVFSQALVREALKPYVLVMLYVDVVPPEFYKEELSGEQRSAEGEANYAFEQEALTTAQVPLYAIIK